MSDLDNFFAKKDKKKVKKGKKFTTTDEIAKRLEDTEKKSEKSIHAAAATEHAKKEELIITDAAAAAAAVVVDGEPEPKPVEVEVVKEVKVEEEMWNDFKDDTMVDVSNLKITKLNIEEEEEGRGENKDEFGGESGDDKKDGVWKVEEHKSIQSTICEAVDAGTDKGIENVKATVAAMANNTRWTSQLAKELAPSLLPRGSGAGPVTRRKKLAPDINSSMAFPSLADAQATASRKTKGDEISEIRNNSHYSSANILASRDTGSGAYKPPMFRTNNRFGALTDQSGRHS